MFSGGRLRILGTNVLLDKDGKLGCSGTEEWYGEALEGILKDARIRDLAAKSQNIETLEG